MAAGDLAGKYDSPFDRESAFEILKARAERAAAEAAAAEEAEYAGDSRPREFNQARRYQDGRVPRSRSRLTGQAEGLGGAVANVRIKELKGTTGRRIVRGILGGLFRGR